MTPRQIKDIVDTFYANQPQLRHILLHHSHDVALLALETARRRHLDIPENRICAAAMLHDIGIVRTDAAGILCFGTEPYICHGTIGAQMLRDLGVNEIYCRVAERHTGAGLTADDIISQHLPLLPRDLLPETTLEKLICYADKFYSKTSPGTRKPLQRVIASMQRFGDDSLQRFMALHAMFAD